nr:hypothetical protein [uncultured Oscillibacter sp.]
MIKAKNVERFLFSCVGLDAWRDKRTRNFVKKTSKNIEKMHEIGLRDSKAGERRVSKAELYNQAALHDQNESELVKSVLDLAYAAYSAGYDEGKRG